MRARVLLASAIALLAPFACSGPAAKAPSPAPPPAESATSSGVTAPEPSAPPPIASVPSATAASSSASVPSPPGDPPPPEGVVATIRKNRERFKACYKAALAQDPNAQAQVKVRLTLSPKGKVTKAEVTYSSGPKALVECVRTALTQLDYPPPGDGPATFLVPIVLNAQS